MGQDRLHKSLRVEPRNKDVGRDMKLIAEKRSCPGYILQRLSGHPSLNEVHKPFCLIVLTRQSSLQGVIGEIPAHDKKEEEPGVRGGFRTSRRS